MNSNDNNLVAFLSYDRFRYHIQKGSNLRDNIETFVMIIQLLLWSVFQSEAVTDFQNRQVLESHL